MLEMKGQITLQLQIVGCLVDFLSKHDRQDIGEFEERIWQDQHYGHKA
jgi:hypothetical protein